jgi:CubicO group peptidase (beta-lactamase class C family)
MSWQPDLGRLHEAMAAPVAKGEIPGLVTLIAHGDDVQVDAIGTTAFGGDEPMRRDTVFRIASLTKPVTGVATMMLVDDGVLRLDEPVAGLLPELAEPRVLRHLDGPLDDTVPAERPITVRDLLTFRLGHGAITEPTFDPPFPIVQRVEELNLRTGPPDPRTPYGPDEWMQKFGSLPLMDQPGARWRYNVGTLVLGVLIARASGRSLPDFFAERIFGPLGLRHTGFSLPAEEAEELPEWYMTDFATNQLTVQSSPPSLWSRPPVFPSGSAGLVSTVDEFLTLARLLRNGGEHEGKRLLSAESVAAMTTNQLTDEQVATAGVILGGRGWGLAQSVAVAPDDVSATPGRYGWEGGYGTTWFNDPHRDVTAIAFTQVSDFLFNGTMNEFGRLALAD